MIESIPTSSSELGAEPSIQVNGLNGSGSTLCAIWGGPPPEGPIRSPFSSRIAIEVESEMPPDAFSTPSTAATF